jgi:hypothetical protein
MPYLIDLMHLGRDRLLRTWKPGSVCLPLRGFERKSRTRAASILGAGSVGGLASGSGPEEPP